MHFKGQVSRSLPLKMPSIIGAAPSQRRCLVVLTASSWVLLTSWCEGFKKHFFWQMSTLFFFCKKVLFDMMYRATNPRHHQAYVALARSCLRDEGDNCAGGVVKNVYVCTTVRALVRTCVCTSVWLKLCCARLSQAFPAATGLSEVKLKLGQKGFRTWVAYSLRLI